MYDRICFQDEYEKNNSKIYKIINYRKRYLDISKRINNLYDQAIDEYKFYGPDNNYIKGFSCCARDLITFIAIVSK